MPGFNPEKINIHDLTVEDPEKEAELPFDAERDITASDWENMKEMLKHDKWQIVSWDFVELAGNMKTLNPDMDLSIDQTNWAQAKKDLDAHYKAPFKWTKFAELAMSARILNPEINLDIDETAWNGIQAELQVYQHSDSAQYFINSAELMRCITLIDPKRDLHISQEYLKKMEREMNRLRNIHADGFLKIAAALKTINPQINLNMSGEDWTKANKMLEWHRSQGIEGMHAFSDTAVNMKIIADSGLYDSKSSFKNYLPQIPEQKQF